MSELSKRELLAGMAMQGYIAAHAGLVNNMPYESEVAKNCVGYANALLAELEKTAPKPVADDDGWIAHETGGEMPCKTTDKVFVRFRSGEQEDESFTAGQYIWTHDGSLEDIIAWRPAR